VSSGQSGGADEIYFNIEPRPGDFSQRFQGHLSPSCHHQIAAFTIGGHTDRRRDITLVASRTSGGPFLAVNPTITAIRVDRLDFDRHRWTVTDFLSELLRTVISIFDRFELPGP
jgi:hypothetical protein